MTTVFGFDQCGSHRHEGFVWNHHRAEQPHHDFIRATSASRHSVGMPAASGSLDQQSIQSTSTPTSPNIVSTKTRAD